MLLATLLVTSASAPGADNDIAKARAFLDGDTADERSLTRRVHDFLALDPSVVRKTEAEAWELSGHSIAMENRLRFLHGMDLKLTTSSFGRNGLVVAGGAVVRRRNSGWGPGGGVMSVDPRSYDELFGKSPSLKVRLPRAVDLLVFLRREVEGLPATGMDDFGQALGEACSDDDEGFSRIDSAYDAVDDALVRRVFTVALGWSRRPSAVDRLSAHVRRIAAELAATGRTSESSGFVSTVTRALKHADAAAFRSIVSGCPTPVGDHLVAAVGDDAIVQCRLSALDAASSLPSRREALRRVCDMGTLRRAGTFFGAMPQGSDARRFLCALLEAADSGDASLRKDAMDAFEWVRPLSADEPEAALRRLTSDAADGRIVVRHTVSLWERTARSTSDVNPRISADWTEVGLRVRVANVSDQAFALNVDALRHLTAFAGDDTGRGDPAGRHLHLRFWAYRGDGVPTMAFTERSLVVVRPKGEHEVVVPLAKQFRKLDHVTLTLEPQLVVGDSPAPVLTFESTRIL